jgi:hypothetical protein
VKAALNIRETVTETKPEIIPIDREISEKMNVGLIDPHVLEILEESAWCADTAYPGANRELRHAWIEANSPERRKPELLQCLVTGSLLKKLYYGSGLLMMHVDDPVAGEVPHFIFWKDASQYCENVYVKSKLHASLHDVLYDIAEGKTSFEEADFVDLTGSQFSPGSKMVIIDPLSDAYAAEWEEHLENEPTFLERIILLTNRFETVFRKETGRSICDLSEPT